MGFYSKLTEYKEAVKNDASIIAFDKFKKVILSRKPCTFKMSDIRTENLRWLVMLSMHEDHRGEYRVPE